MKSHELIKNHEGIIFFYPFSGTDFEIIKELNNLAKAYSKKALFIYCSFGGNFEEFERFASDNPTITRGLYTDVNYIENKLGLKGIEIASSQKLIDTTFDASYYTFDDTELIFVKGEAFHYIDHLLNEGIDLYKLNLVLSYAEGFNEKLKNLMLTFSPLECKEADEYHPKMITINNHYLTDVEESFSDSELYKWRKEFEVKQLGVATDYKEFYSILFEKEEDYLIQNVLSRFI
jgi:hypothetical protein